MKTYQQTFNVWNGETITWDKFKHNPRLIKRVCVYARDAPQYNINISLFSITVTALNNKHCKIKFTVYYSDLENSKPNYNIL